MKENKIPFKDNHQSPDTEERIVSMIHYSVPLLMFRIRMHVYRYNYATIACFSLR